LADGSSTFDVLLTEDLKGGAQINGVTIVDPFTAV